MRQLPLSPASFLPRPSLDAVENQAKELWDQHEAGDPVLTQRAADGYRVDARHIGQAYTRGEGQQEA